MTTSIIPDEETRVRLKGKENDYINANYIKVNKHSLIKP